MVGVWFDVVYFFFEFVGMGFKISEIFYVGILDIGGNGEGVFCVC